MSRYVTKRAQEAWSRYRECYKAHIAASKADDGSREHAKKISALWYAMELALLEYDAALRTERIVAAGDAVDVSSVLDGAL